MRIYRVLNKRKDESQDMIAFAEKKQELVRRIELMPHYVSAIVDADIKNIQCIKASCSHLLLMSNKARFIDI